MAATWNVGESGPELFVAPAGTEIISLASLDDRITIRPVSDSNPMPRIHLWRRRRAA